MSTTRPAEARPLETTVRTVRHIRPHGTVFRDLPVTLPRVRFLELPEALFALVPRRPAQAVAR